MWFDSYNYVRPTLNIHAYNSNSYRQLRNKLEKTQRGRQMVELCEWVQKDLKDERMTLVPRQAEPRFPLSSCDQQAYQQIKTKSKPGLYQQARGLDVGLYITSVYICYRGPEEKTRC
jgi:hypothetical protein